MTAFSPDPKQELRLLAKIKTRSLGLAYRCDASQIICDLLSELVKNAGITRVFTYYGKGCEAATKPFIEDCLASNVKVCLPVCFPKGMDFFEIDGLPLKEGRFGIPEPEPSGPPESPEPSDLFIVPAVALGRDGRRIGHGGGYYDRYLADSAAFKVGICFDAVLFDRLPSDGYDIPVDMIITETGVKPADVG